MNFPPDPGLLITLKDSAPTPWTYDGLSHLRDAKGKPVGKVLGWAHENIVRILACINACAGYKDPVKEVKHNGSQ